MKPQEKIAAGIIAGSAAMMASPLVAEAAVTPSLQNLLNSLVAGGLVAAAIAGAVVGVANFGESQSPPTKSQRAASSDRVVCARSQLGIYSI